MLNLILSGVVISLVTEYLKKKGGNDKIHTLWTVLLLSTIVSVIAVLVLDYHFWPTLGWIVVFAGAFYAYVLRNIPASKPTLKPKVITKKKKK